MKQKVNRRDFFKLFCLDTTGTTFFKEAMAATAKARPAENKPTFVIGPVKLNKAKETVIMCTDCDCCCKLIVYSEDDRVIQVERFTDNPGNDDFTCCKIMNNKVNAPKLEPAL